jgi:hypothetical protein
MPTELYEVARSLCHQEHRTQSELFREALRRYAELALPLPDWQRELLDERRQAYEANPDDVLSWEEIEANAKADLAHQRQ